MAIKTSQRLSEAELNAPDLDDDGRTDVEYYPLSQKINSGSAYLDRIWAAAARQLNAQGE